MSWSEQQDENAPAVARFADGTTMVLPNLLHGDVMRKHQSATVQKLRSLPVSFQGSKNETKKKKALEDATGYYSPLLFKFLSEVSRHS